LNGTQYGVRRVTVGEDEKCGRVRRHGEHDQGTLTVLAAAAWWARQRLGIAEPMWTLIGLYTRGRLLAPPG
jgi:hypothetical protein